MSAALCEIEGVEIAGQTSDTQMTVDSVRRLSPDVVIIDVMLDGDMSLDALRTIKTCDPAPIVLVFTNYTDAEYREKSMDAGADFFFSKSTEFNPMLDTLRSLLKHPGHAPANS